ncbi:MAG: hypothetical protein J4224_00600 [Candidatus Diapherotrites archaeon]|uniref:Band 7 domain-containing protein n=1 Tax=Candidatus Iainarchaeum sp. TaxID=3101447 RepID=A0A7J4IRP6_9ARCH|nr:MAG: hypothetical protein QT03_C0001G1271 [archaeon GW2011_AR10]MBS3058907.1 hypothetical protein [Candidatus Diapherotrites archaeon]HIH08112.1 hypothetical protein [Candidatus Diapherotrites archaeon]
MAQKLVKQAIFGGVIILLFILLVAIIQLQDFFLRNILWIFLGLIVLFLVWKYDYLLQLKDFERAVIFRLGKVHRVGGPGWAILLPPIETYYAVDVRTQTIDVKPQNVVTKDQVEVRVDAVIYLKVRKDNESVIKSIVEVQDYRQASQLYVVALIRDAIGTMNLSELISNVEQLNAKMEKGLSNIAHSWGVTIESAKITTMDIPAVVLSAMHDQKAAVQKKLARIEAAEAQKIEIDAVKAAAEQLNEKALAYYYVKALEKVGEGKSTKFIFPMELSRLAEAIGGRIAGKEK